ncbi:MAG: phosphatase PAP2 family protein [Candidatus Pacebacteria bacterium]|nr:phosphatase PAP2 family protein [Candidatus Paceibacterota bacterium]
MFPLDQQLFSLIHDLAGKSRLLDLFMIFLADYSGYFIILIFILLMLTEKPENRILKFLFIAFALILSRGLFTQILRFFIDQPRPFITLAFKPLLAHESVNGFPSGHMAFFFVFVFFVFSMKNRSWGLVFSVATLLMGFARVFCGVHWPSDIVGGILVAFISVFITSLLFPKLQKNNQP